MALSKEEREAYRLNRDGILDAALQEAGSATALAKQLGVPATTVRTWTQNSELTSPYSAALVPHKNRVGGGVDSSKTTKVVVKEVEPAELLRLRARVERAEAESKSAKAQLKHAARHSNIVADVRDMIAPVVASFELPALPKPKPVRSRKRKQLSMIWHFNDLHAGEIVTPRVMNDVNAYNPNIMMARVEHTLDTIVKLADDSESGVGELVIAVNGDTIGGDLHLESAEYVARAGRQTIAAAGLLAQVGFEAAQVFPKVRFLGTVGNHPRTTRKMPTGSARVDTSWELLLHELAYGLMRNVGTITYEVASGYTLTTKIGPDTYAFAHGDATKGGGGSLGIPAYGLKRAHDANREWSLVQAQLTEAAISSIIKRSRYAHFHAFMHWQAGNADIMLGPSPKGVDPYVKDCLGKYSPPMFVAEVVHPDHGMIGLHPIDLTHIVDMEATGRYVWNDDGSLGMVADTHHAWVAGR